MLTRVNTGHVITGGMSDNTNTPAAHSVTAVRRILADIAIGPSCLNMGWAWDVEAVFHDDGYSMKPELCGYRIRTTFQRPERDTGEVKRGTGGWHFVPHGATVSDVVKRAYVAAEAIVRHELMEAFHYKGARIFDPHNTVAQLAVLQTMPAEDLGKYLVGTMVK